MTQEKQKPQLNIPVVIHRCKLVPYGNEEKRCVKCGYITWNSKKSDTEIIEDMIEAGYDVPACDNGVQRDGYKRRLQFQVHSVV